MMAFRRPERKCGLAVNGIERPNRLLRNGSGKLGTPLSLTKRGSVHA